MSRNCARIVFAEFDLVFPSPYSSDLSAVFSLWLASVLAGRVAPPVRAGKCTGHETAAALSARGCVDHAHARFCCVRTSTPIPSHNVFL